MKIRPKYDIYTGDPLFLSINPTIDGEPVPSDSVVKAVILDTVNPATQSQKLTDEVTFAYDGNKGVWEATFESDQTLKLLSNPNDPSSSVAHTKVIIEFQVAGMTAHKSMTVGKGVIQ